ncbi:hypothetical protein [Roseateles sp.]|uniref:hypothetical protein n=1 Tax=Roseateles sp. TaxID=1971397 RepID=UPI0025F6F191|nr:hypothetical protein [Roseateles sp.]MBV8035945.1 hypothetical protein [Roseateles sp.]
MKTSLTGLALCALGASLAASAATEADRPAERGAERDLTRHVQLALSDLPVRIALGDQALAFAGRELGGERVVRGAPYCATAVHENVQSLADGNRIVRRQQSQLCRDGEGRTRREVQREGGPRVVYLNDPVAKTSWVIYPDEKRAQKLRGSAGWAPDADAAAHAAWQASMQDWGERMKEQAARWKEWGARVAEQARSADAERVRARAQAGEPGIVIERELAAPTAPASGAVERRRELRVIRASELPAPPAPPAPMATPAPPMPPMPPMPLLQGLTLPPREGGTTTELPPREIEGLKVNGERTTWTIEAGRIGNEKPIVSTREVWRSPELMLTVMSRDADPRQGEQNYRLEKIRRGEPDPALMKPPADYGEGPRRSTWPAASAPTRSS